MSIENPNLGAVTHIGSHLEEHHKGTPVHEGNTQGTAHNHATHQREHGGDIFKTGGNPVHTHKERPLFAPQQRPRS